MTKKTNPIVTYRQIDQAFNKNHEAVMETALNEAVNATNDPIEAGMMLASLGNALKTLEAADNGTRAGVLLSTEHKVASLLQSYLADKSEEEDKLDPLAAGGEEAKFDEKDLFRWFFSLFTWLKGIKSHPWLQAPAAPDPFPDGVDTVRLALLGDWGTGLYGAPVCASSIESDRTGYQMLFHLGDVYYSGDKKEVRDRFLQYWPTNARAISRAMNSNHEMYTGGKAYFEQTLTEFKQKASYFAFQNDHWLLVGLDSAYNDPDLKFDKATLTDDQITWLTNLVNQKGSRKLILFSHHQPISWFDLQKGEMNNQLSAVLNNQQIFAWYWGHEHRCILYDKHPNWGFYGRCAGHSGYPYFRDKLGAAAVEVETQGVKWRRMPANNMAPSGLILDGPNQYLPGEEEDYGANGYMTLEFRDDKLNEIVHAPDGTRLYERELI
ncbi:MAG TPA: hypothetical protein VHS05_05015 [Pyrinomonadaceae bacterium]|jgi:hypothetical protein|nr:hypothetical protein [Pyrinomonadaceae bacterium]